MNALTRISIAMVASALMLAGCASSTPGLFIDSARANVNSSPVFSDQETPTIRYSLPESEVSGVAVKVVMQPAGITVRRQYAAASRLSGFEDSGFEIDHPTHFEPEQTRKMEFPGLLPGNYTAELWIKGKRESSLDFSVSDSTGQGSLQRHVAHVPGTGEIFVPPATAKFWASRKEMNPAVAQIDTFVGLTDEQKAEVTKIYLDETLPAVSSSGNPAERQFVWRQQIRAKVHALLSPEQQKLYDDDGSIGRWVEPLLNRLDELVGLTPEQKAEAAKIVDAENLAPKQLSPIYGWVENKVADSESAQARILALLTPSQKKIYDDAPKKPGGGSMKGRHYPAGYYPPSAAPFRERVTYIGDLIKKSLAITARLGLITEVKPVWGPGSTFEGTMKSAGHPDSASGQFRYSVAGSERSELLTVYWKKASPTAPIDIVKIEGSTGEVIFSL